MHPNHWRRRFARHTRTGMPQCPMGTEPLSFYASGVQKLYDNGTSGVQPHLGTSSSAHEVLFEPSVTAERFIAALFFVRLGDMLGERSWNDVTRFQLHRQPRFSAQKASLAQIFLADSNPPYQFQVLAATSTDYTDLKG